MYQTTLLTRVWTGFFGEAIKFERYSPNWSKLGFQHGMDPASDVRGGGELALECIVYFVENHTPLVKEIFSKNSIRTASRGPYAVYPFACAAITLTKRLCEVLQICEPITGRTTTNFANTPATYWHLAGSKESFMNIFVWFFVSLDKLWDETSASYMDFGRICNLATVRLVDVIQRLPADVVPFAGSHAADMNRSKTAEFQFHFEITEPLKTGNVEAKQSTIPTADLLSLDELEGRSTCITDASDYATEENTAVDFFAGFGLN